MTECTTGSHVTGLLFGFVFYFAMHAVPMTYLFVRWGQRYYWGFLPAVFSALIFLPGFDADSPCSVIQSEFLSSMLAALFASASYLSLVFFKPRLHLGALFGEALIPVVLAIPLVGAVSAVVWLLLSLGRERMLLDQEIQVTFKFRLLETLGHSVVVAAACAFLASSLSE